VGVKRNIPLNGILKTIFGIVANHVPINTTLDGKWKESATNVKPQFHPPENIVIIVY
jgi:hypothetical protein